MNQAQPLTGRWSVFRTTRAVQRMAGAGPAYVGATGFVRSSGCLQVGLALSSNDPEYMLWALLADARWRGRLEAVLVANVSARLADGWRPAFRPCAIVRVAAAPSGAGLSLGEQYYRAAWSQREVQVLVPAPPVAELGATASPAVIQLALNGTQFRPGDRVTIGLETRNPLGGVEAWKEHGEGEVIEPHRERGFDRLDAIRAAFAAGRGAHRDLGPQDLGLSVPRAP